ncbi:MAG: NirA family protein [Edaphobacter sp.]|uniref:NirA family protein n=1 Tax=Edaphobacter sp. TaxID=1934404 RepID=UPI0023A2A467|nr:NirA family protein [Edaphobacter sp.]MDE1177939.1 NirA family protein [Edaphobacter sp.]
MSSNAIIHSEEFTTEQKEYLQGFFAGVVQRGFTLPFVGHTTDGRITADPASQLVNQASPEEEPTWFDTPVSDLSREEQWKYQQDPVEIWDKLLEYSNQDRFPNEEDRFRLKYHGLFHVAPAQDSFMLRLRVPGGILSSHQMRGLARISDDYGVCRADLTTRSNIQLRGFAPRHIASTLYEIQSLGLTSKGSGADNIRNITASPITGLDPRELIDVAPLAGAMQAYITNTRAMYDLPRKFNIAFDNGGTITALADTNDIGFLAVRVTEGHSIPAGIYFRVVLSGITGHRQFASDCGLLLRPQETVAVAAAMIRVFVQHGDRTNRKKARLKYLLDRWGVERFLEETEKVLAFPLIRVPIAECEPRGPIDRHAHLGIHAQLQPQLRYIGISVPVGQLPSDKMRAIAEIADRFGSGELRLTVWQNLIIPNIDADKLDEACHAILAADLSYEAGTVLSGTVACTGNKGCRFAAADTKSHAVSLARHLDERFPILDQAINLHVTGCNNSCAQHYIGDIGLMGVKVGGEEGYQVLIGGGADNDQGLGRELISSIRFSNLAPKLDGLFHAYLFRRKESETFLEFTRRHDIEELRSFCHQEVV